MLCRPCFRDLVVAEEYREAERQADTASDNAQAALEAAQAAIAAANGFEVSSYLGEISSLDQAPVSASANSGKWYTITIEGTLTDAAVSGLAVKVGDRILSNGTAWQRWVQPPTYITAGAIQRFMLEKSIRDLMIETDDPDFAAVWVDRSERRALAIRHNGNVVANFELQDEAVTTPAIAADAVTRSKLSEEIRGAIPETTDNANEFQYSIEDLSGRVAFGVREDGTTFLRFLVGDENIFGSSIVSSSIAQSKLDGPAKRNALSGSGDIIQDVDDGLRRGAQADLSAATDAVAGAVPVAFPSINTPFIYGVNGSGTSLEFCRAPGFVIRGTNYRGTWSAGAVVPNTTADEGDWWAVSSGGTLSGVTYATGDRIVCLGNTKQSSVVTPVWAKSKPGEFWCRGEFTPGSGLPGTPANGEVYIASASGTASPFTFAAGDWLLRTGGAWLQVAREDLKTVAAGAAWSYRVRNAAEIMVRRTDKSTTSVNATASVYRTSNQRRTSDAIIFRGDSMVATGGLNTALAALISPRTLASQSWSAGNSAHVISAALKDLVGSDPYRGWMHLWMMGTNDYGDDDLTKRGALKAAQLSGAADGRCLFLTVCGQFVLSYNGTRIVADVHEGIMDGSHHLAALERWYASTFPGRHIRTLKALLDRAPSIPSLHFPGKTEAEAAALYGAAPTSFFFDYASKAFTPAQLNFAGYRSTAGLPTGGADGDYWIRTGNGTVGQPIIRWGGTWTEYVLDITHITPAGNAALAAAISEFLTDNML
jgi:hypothetical protein